MIFKTFKLYCQIYQLINHLSCFSCLVKNNLKPPKLMLFIYSGRKSITCTTLEIAHFTIVDHYLSISTSIETGRNIARTKRNISDMIKARLICWIFGVINRRIICIFLFFSRLCVAGFWLHLDLVIFIIIQNC